MKILNKRLKHKYVFALAVLALALALIPIFMMARYNVMSADDYSYGYHTHKAYLETGSIIKVLEGAVRTTRESYYDWQGTFSAIFLMSLQPGVFGEQMYVLSTYLMLLSLLAGIFSFCFALFSGLFGAEKSVSGIIAVLIALASTQLLPSPVQGFYWYNGSVYYTFFYGLFLICSALVLSFCVKGRGIYKLVLASLLAAFIGGGNYVTALSGSVLAVSTVALLAVLKKPQWKAVLIPALALLVCFAISVAAPGNSLRQELHTGVGPVSAILLSLKWAAVKAAEWASLPMLGILLLMLPFAWHGAAESGFSFKLPGLVSLYSYGLFASMFCPHIYAMGIVGPGRLENILYFAYVLIVTINIFYWCGWISCRKSRQHKGGDGIRISVLCGAAALMLCCLALGAHSNSYTSYVAISPEHLEEAKVYYQVAQERLESLKDDSIKDVHLKAYPCLPYLLFFDDATTAADEWQNQAMCSYYNKNYVVVESGS